MEGRVSYIMPSFIYNDLKRKQQLFYSASSPVSSPSGEGAHLSTWEQILSQHRRSSSSEFPSVPSCFTSVSVTLPLLLLCLFHQQGFFFLLQLFHCYQGITTRENYAMADAFPSCPNSTASAGFIGPIHTWMVSFFYIAIVLCNQYYLQKDQLAKAVYCWFKL